MHASSLENMRECYRRYIAGGPLEAQPAVSHGNYQSVSG